MVNTIIKGIQEKKGSNIVVADLKEIEGAITNYFVICQGNSPTQVEAIAESIGETVRKELKDKPTSAVGLGLNQWVAIRLCRCYRARFHARNALLLRSGAPLGRCQTNPPH